MPAESDPRQEQQAIPTTMRAARIHAFGGPEELRVEEIPVPRPGAGEVLVRVAYAGLNPLDYKQRDGSSASARGITLPAVLGRELAGHVIGAADDVNLEHLGMPVGTPVLGVRAMDDLRGTDAEVVAMAAETLAPIPGGVNANGREADGVAATGAAAGGSGANELEALVPFAGIGIAGLTAQAAIRAAHVGPGDTVLVHGGTGGVGQLILPLLVRAGAGRIWATGRAENAVRIAELGATPIPYDDADWRSVIHEATGGRGVDVIVDTHYHGTFLPSLDALAPGGRIVSLPSLSDLTPARERGIEAHIPAIRPDRESLSALAAELADGTLSVEVSEVVPLAEIARAHEQLETGHTRGKLILEL